MNKTIARFLLFVFTFILLVVLLQSKIQACTSLSVSPSSGYQTGAFSIYVQGCTNSIYSSYFLSAVSSDGSGEDKVQQLEPSTSGDPGDFTTVLRNMPVGTYELRVYDVQTEELFPPRAHLTILPQDDSTRDNTYWCEVDRRDPPRCILHNLSNQCLEGYSPGNACSSTSLGNCESVSYECSTDNILGDEGEPCKRGNFCDAGLFCDTDLGFTCKRCGGANEMCCPQPNTNANPPCVSGNICQNNVCVGEEPNRGDLLRSGLLCEGELAINTALGCVNISDASKLTSFFLRFSIGVGGGIAFLLLIYGGFTIMTSVGNPDRLKAGQGLIVSAISGLAIIIFSIFILRIIGADILQIPSFL